MYNHLYIYFSNPEISCKCKIFVESDFFIFFFFLGGVGGWVGMWGVGKGYFFLF